MENIQTSKKLQNWNRSSKVFLKCSHNASQEYLIGQFVIPPSCLDRVSFLNYISHRSPQSITVNQFTHRQWCVTVIKFAGLVLGIEMQRGSWDSHHQMWWNTTLTLQKDQNITFFFQTNFWSLEWFAWKSKNIFWIKSSFSNEESINSCTGYALHKLTVWSRIKWSFLKSNSQANKQGTESKLFWTRIQKKLILLWFSQRHWWL